MSLRICKRSPFIKYFIFLSVLVRRSLNYMFCFIISAQDDTIQLSIQDFMQFCGSRMLDLLIIYYSKWNNNSRSTYYTAVAKLKNLMTTEQFKNVETYLSNKIRRGKLLSLTLTALEPT